MLTRALAVATAVACLTLAFVPAQRAASGLSMPYDMDHFREIASAQAIADGKVLRDPYYRGERIWYNPLLATTIATVAKTTRLDVGTAFVQSGPYLTVLAQLAFFTMAACLVRPWPAALALAALLFAPPHTIPSWATPAVTLWLYPNNFASAFFYLGLLACWCALDRHRLAWWAVAGTTLGIVFLAHSAPALVLGLAMVAAVALGLAFERSLARQRLIGLAVLLCTAVVVSAPLLVSIVGHYHLRIINRDPLDWVWNGIDLSHLGELLQDGLLSWRGALQIVGTISLLRRVRIDRGARLVVCWLAAAAAFLAYGYVQQIVGFDHVRPLLPQHHFFFYLKAAGHLLTGVGAWAVIVMATHAIAQRTRKPLQARESPLSAALAMAAIGMLVATNYSAYEMRADFQEYQREARHISDEFVQTQVLQRLRRQTPADAVVLASDEDSYYRVAPAGRFVVSVPSIQSNPYLAQGGRDNDQEQMIAALLHGDVATFDRLADQYAVTNVLLAPQETAQLDATGVPAGELQELSRQAGYALYARPRRAAP